METPVMTRNIHKVLIGFAYRKNKESGLPSMHWHYGGLDASGMQIYLEACARSHFLPPIFQNKGTNHCKGATFTLCDIKHRCQVAISLVRQNGSGNSRRQTETILVNCRPTLGEHRKAFCPPALSRSGGAGRRRFHTLCQFLFPVAPAAAAAAARAVTELSPLLLRSPISSI